MKGQGKIVKDGLISIPLQHKPLHFTHSFVNQRTWAEMPGSAIQSGGEGIEGRKTHPIDYVLPVLDHHLSFRKPRLSLWPLQFLVYFENTTQQIQIHLSSTICSTVNIPKQHHPFLSPMYMRLFLRCPVIVFL